MVESKEKNDGDLAATFIENESLEILIIFPSKPPNPGSFSIPCVVGKAEIERALCDLDESISLMPYSLFHRLHLGPLQPAPFSLQLTDGYEMKPLRKLEDVPVKIGDIWVLEGFIIDDMTETNDARYTR